MKGRGSPPGRPHAADWRAAGFIASGVAPELVRPLRELRDELAAAIDALDFHITESKGPDPYPWEATRALRERLAEAYFHSRDVTRLASHLAEAIGPGPGVGEVVEVRDCVESALALTRAQVSAETEIFVDYGEVGQVRAPSGRLVLALAQLILASAESAWGVTGAALAIRTRAEREPGEPEIVTISIADSGAGSADGARTVEAWVAQVAAEAGGSLVATAKLGRGTAFEMRLPALARGLRG
jgi:C4-dicarboxylate-specific signal transduction histidine kinase